MADDQPSAGTASAVAPKKDVPVGAPKANVPTGLSVSEQGAQRDWQFLLQIVLALMFLLTGPVTVNVLTTLLSILTTALSVVFVSTIQLLWYLITDDTGLPVISLLLIVATYGGYSIMPIWLRPPIEKTLAQSGYGTHEKVGNDQLINHDGRQLKSNQYSIDVSRLAEMGYTPITTVHDFFEADPVIGADGKVHCPVIIAVVKSAPSVDLADTPQRLITSHLTSIGPRVNDDNKITVEAANSLSHSDVAPGSIQDDLLPQDKSVAGPIDTSHVLDESITIAADVHNAIVKEAVAAKEGSDASSDDTLGLDELFTPASPALEGSVETPTSSDESEVCGEDRSLPKDEYQETEDGAPEHMTREIDQPYRMKNQLSSEELDHMAKTHGYPSFCVGPLWIAVTRQAPDVRSYYLDHENKEIFPASCLVTEARPISADGKDMDFMLERLGDKVPAAIQRLLPDNVDILHQTRNGATGSNMHMAELTEQFFEHYHKLPNLEAVRLHEKEKTLRQRFGLVPGVEETSEYRQWFDLLPGVEETPEHRQQFDLLPRVEESSEHRRFLTNDEEVKLGCADYLEIGAENDEAIDAEDDEDKILKTLKNHPDHDGAKLPNLVLPWLDGIDELGLYDPNAYLPCDCGKAALATHSESRQNAEPGIYLCPDDHHAPQLALLSENALQKDRERKNLENQHSSASVGCLRSQQIIQNCELHAVYTNKPYVFTDVVENWNDALVTTGDDLPVPGFWKCNKYPPGFIMPYGFLDLEHRDRPPRCRHGNLHPPFAGHCVRCFPTGEHDGDCSECDGHAHASALKVVGTKEKDINAAGEQWDQRQLKKIRAAASWEKEIASRAEHSWPLPRYRPWHGW